MTETRDLNAAEDSVAAWIARALKAQGVTCVFGLQGGHIQPVWDHVARLGIRIIDVRDEGAAIHMAHAWADLNGGIGVAMATAGPGEFADESRDKPVDPRRCDLGSKRRRCPGIAWSALASDRRP